MSLFIFFFFFNDTATTEIYTLSLHDALPISHEEPFKLFRITTSNGRPIYGAALEASLRPLRVVGDLPWLRLLADDTQRTQRRFERDRKSTRLNSSHRCISYAVFCLKKKNNSE